MKYTINNYRTRKINDKYFITTDHGSYVILNDNELKQLKSININNKLFEKLKEKEILITESNLNEAIRLTKNRTKYICDGASLHIIVITKRCNMNCVYCHASSESSEKSEMDMDTKTIENTVDFILQSPAQTITIEFQGGEPMLNWDGIKHCIEYAKKKNTQKNIIFTIVSNFSLMDEEKAKYIIDNNIYLCTSLDGHKELHDKNRKYSKASNYDQVSKWITFFDKKDIKVSALVTITKNSLNYYKEIIDEYVKHNIQSIHLRYLNILGVAKNAINTIGYSAEEFIEFWIKAVEYIEKLKKQEIKIEERMVRIMTQKILTEYDPNYLELRSPCGAAIGQLAYNYNGKIYTCDEARMLDEDIFMIGNVAKDNYKDVVTCDKSLCVINASINDQFICDSCAYKPYCGLCPVCNYSEKGSIISNVSTTNRCKIHIAQFDWVVKNIVLNNS